MTVVRGFCPQSDEHLTEVASRVREIMRLSGLSRTLEIGQLMLERFYAGDEREWRSRRSRKNNSIRKLAARPDCPIGKSSLNEALGIYVAARTLPFLHDARHIGAGHIAAVLQLDQCGRERWLQRAEREALSVRELRKLLVQDRRSNGERRGRPNLSLVGRLTSRVRASLKLLGAELEEIATLADCERSELETLCTQIEELRRVCERVLNLGRLPRLAERRSADQPRFSAA